MGRHRSSADEQVAELLRTAKEALGLSLSFLSRMDGTTQHLEVVESSVPVLFRDGTSQPQQTSFCQAIAEGRLPPVIPDVAALPAARELPAARFPRIRSFVSVPVTLSDGRTYGTFCAAGFTANASLRPRDQALMEVLARAAAAIIEPELQDRERREEILGRMKPVLADGGPAVLLQPIVALATGARVGAEALSRFPAAWAKPPDLCFAEAHDAGLGIAMEMAALRRAAGLLDLVSGYVALNVSAATLFHPDCVALLERLAADRVVLELSEHDPVDDYPRLTQVLEPLRAAGMLLAVDDVGAGYSSLRHIVMTSPDVIKLDRWMIAGVSADPTLATLVRAMVTFAGGCGSRVVAEGIETAEDAAALTELGVGYGQGWFFGRPAAAGDLGEAVAVGLPGGASGVSALPPPRGQMQRPAAVTPR